MVQSSKEEQKSRQTVKDTKSKKKDDKKGENQLKELERRRLQVAKNRLRAFVIQSDTNDE